MMTFNDFTYAGCDNLLDLLKNLDKSVNLLDDSGYELTILTKWPIKFFNLKPQTGHNTSDY